MASFAFFVHFALAACIKLEGCAITVDYFLSDRFNFNYQDEEKYGDVYEVAFHISFYLIIIIKPFIYK